MFWTRHLTNRLAEYCDGRLHPSEAAKAETHLSTCANCRAAVVEYRAVAGAMTSLPTLPAPDAIWRAIDAELARREPKPRLAFVSFGRLAAAAIVVVVAASALFMWRSPVETLPSGWHILEVASPRPADRLARGSLVQTDAASRVTLQVGSIGEVDVEPNTHVRLIAATDNQNRMALVRGRISARISAPPRLFFVDTPASTVVDLGCAYTMEADEDGTGSLRVTSGWASLEWAGRESLVPAGASCLTRPRVGPGTPCFDDASEALRRALTAFDFDNGGDAAVDVILRESRGRDTLTLWHLLSRVDGTPARTRVFDRLVALVPLPAGIDRNKAMALDRDTLNRWRQELAWTW